MTSPDLQSWRTSDLPIHISWFPTATPKGPAYGDPEQTTWANFVGALSWYRREDDEKDGPLFVAARLELEPDGRRVRRLKDKIVTRTAIAMDCETNRKTGEVPPAFAKAVARVRKTGWAAVVYTSHNHTSRAPRFRIMAPLSEEIAPDLPAVEVVAERLSLGGILDRSKVGAVSAFYLPSCPLGQLDNHAAEVIDGAPIDAAWIREIARAIMVGREAEKQRQAEAAHREAAARRQAKIAAGFDPDDSLIEKIRAHLDLGPILLRHGYDRCNGKFRHPNSQSGSYGADIKTLSGIERVFSHNANDPLHANNLPDWCGGVTALDAVDATIILDFGGDRRKGLAELAERFGLTKAQERKKLAALLFRLVKQQATQGEIESAAYTEGERIGLSRAEVIQVATWIASRPTMREAA